MPALSLISLNIEGAKHLDLVLPFLKEKNPDVACLQEVNEEDVPKIEEALGGATHIFCPSLHRKDVAGTFVEGNAIFTKLPIQRTESHYYHQALDQNAVFDMTDASTKRRTESLGILLLDVRKGEQCFRVTTTHFTWTPDGSADEYQREDMGALRDILSTFREFVLCGDFNAPRLYQGKPGEIFSMLASKYKDNIPSNYVTSIDPERHRAGKARPEELADKMVDGLFTTPRYAASDVSLQSGVSDHMAILANISIIEPAAA